MSPMHTPRHQLSPELLQLFSGNSLLNHASLAIQVTAVAANGWPHSVLLSMGEIWAASPVTLLFCVWPQSSLVKSVEQHGRLSFSFVHQGLFTEIQTEAVLLKYERDLPVPLALCRAAIQQVKSTGAGYATLTHGIGFALDDAATHLQRWQTQLDLLRSCYAG